MRRHPMKRGVDFAATMALVFAVIALSPGTPVAGATVPGANGRIAFERIGPPFIPSGDIYTINPNGTGIQRLTFGGTGMFPAWSPDGRRIAYTGPAPHAYAIWIMNANGSSAHQLTHPGRSEDLRPAWSPNGKRIVFDRLFGSTTVMWIMNADGTGATRLHRGTEPSWSPNGRWIAFTGANGIWVIRPNGRRAHRVTLWDGGAPVLVPERQALGVLALRFRGRGERQLGHLGAQPGNQRSSTRHSQQGF